MCHIPAQEEVSPETGWFAGYKEAGGCRCNSGNPLQWKRVTKSSSCVLYADPYSTTLVLPRALVWSVFHFPTKGAAGGEKGLVDEWSSAGHRVPAADLSIGKLLTLWLRSACAGCLLYRVLIFQRFLGMNGCCEQREWGCCTFRAIAACGVYRLLNKDCQHARDVCWGPVLCIWPYISAEGVVQMLGAKEEWQCPSKSAQPAKSSAGGMLCLTAIPVAHAHA